MNENANNIRDHLANERTFLAWLRTGVGIMAFGFVVVKFSLFVKQLSLVLGKQLVVNQKGYSAIIGIVLVSVGTISCIFSYMRYRKTAKQIDENNFKSSSLLISLITGIIFFISLLLIAYLVKSV